MSFKYSPQQLFNKISGSLAAGNNVTLSSDGNTITISSTGGGGGSSTNAFATASVSGQSDIIANSATGAITFAAGSGISLTTNASTDTLTIASSGGGGGSTYTQWDAMAPPATAHALDDEFTGSLTGWSTWNPGSVTFSAQTKTDQQMLVLDCDTVPGDRLVGIYKAAPTASSGDYTYAFWSKVSWVSLDQRDYPNVGIFIAEDIAGSPTTAKAWNCVIAQESRFQVRAQGWNNYTSYGGAVASDIYRSFSYLRIRVSYASSTNTTTYNFDHSGDGVGWYQLVQRTYTGHLPYIGFLMNNVNGSDNLQGWCDFFRVYDDYEFYYPPSGSLVERTLA